MYEDQLLEVTDLKQYVCCPRLVYYRYCLPDIRPLTYAMEVGIQSHQQQDKEEIHHSLQQNGVVDGVRLCEYAVSSERLGLKGRIDLLVVAPSLEAAQREAFIVEYKYSELKVGTHFKVQLAAYALLVEEAFNVTVKRSFVYAIPLRSMEEIVITTALRKKVRTTVQAIQDMLKTERMPEPTKAQQRCPTCEFRRFCNDVV